MPQAAHDAGIAALMEEAAARDAMFMAELAAVRSGHRVVLETTCEVLRGPALCGPAAPTCACRVAPVRAVCCAAPYQD